MSGPKILSDRQISSRLRLRDLYVFSAVAQHRSMAKAAAELGVTQPSVSEVIANLEHTYGVNLFDRSPRGVELTVYGEALLRRSMAVFDEVNQSALDMQSLADPSAGEVRIACFEGLLGTTLPEMLRHFARRHPNVVLHVENLAPGSDMSGLRARLFDLALVRRENDGTSLIDDELNVETLYDDDMIVAVGASNPWVARPGVGLQDLMIEPWILPPPGYWHYPRVEEAFRAQGLSVPKVRIFSPSIILRMLLMSDGPYITVFASSVMRWNAERYGIVALPISMPTRPWPVVLVTLKNRTQSAAVQSFVASVREVARSMSGRL
jgi:DNA-binding transcriptional LysR family regulator